MSDVDVDPAEVRRLADQMDVVAAEASSSRAAVADGKPGFAKFVDILEQQAQRLLPICPILVTSCVPPRMFMSSRMRKLAMRSTPRCGRRVQPRERVAAVVLAVLFAVGCGGGDGGYDSPLLNEDVPVMDIADLPDIDQTRAQMLDLIERVRDEVTRLTPATAPWEWKYDESTGGCTQEETGRKGVSLAFAKLVSARPFTDAEWNHVFPAVQRLAAEAGLTSNAAMQNSSGNHDVRFTNDDGRTLIFASWKAALITGRIACRRPAESPAS